MQDMGLREYWASTWVFTSIDINLFINKIFGNNLFDDF